VKIATFAKPETVSTHPTRPTRPKQADRICMTERQRYLKLIRSASPRKSPRFCITILPQRSKPPNHAQKIF